MIADQFGKREFGTEDSQMSVEELCGKYQTDVHRGLKKELAEALLKKEGKNLINPKINHRHFGAFAVCMSAGVNLLLWLVTALCLANAAAQIVQYDQLDTTALISCLFLLLSALSVGLISLLQIKPTGDPRLDDKFVSKETEVIRDGEKMIIPTEDLVVGDLIFLKRGDRVPADVRIVGSENFIVDNFVLAGVHDQQQYLHEKIKEGNLLERPNVAFRSCSVIEGTARGIVIRKGRGTAVATIFDLPEKETKPRSPITVQIVHLLNLSAYWVTALGVIFTTIFWFSSEGRKAADTLNVFVLIFFGCLSENLLFVALLTLRLYSRKLSWRCCTVRSIGAMERLPFVSAMCLNKPGVVTQNRAVVTNLWFDKKNVEIWGGTKIVWREKASATFKELAKCAVLGIEAEFKQEDEENVPILKRKITGNPDDAAIFKFFCYIMGDRVSKLREAHPRVAWIRSGVNRKFHLSVHKAGKKLLMILVGEPETLLEKCSTYSLSGASLPIDAAFRESIDKACVEFAKFGETIKCIVEQTVVLEEDEDEHDYVQDNLPAKGYRFLGIITLFDPPSTNIVRAVERCREAGIKVFLTTDDHPIVARSFARQIGIISEESQTMEEAAEGVVESESHFKAVVIDGNDVEAFSVKGIKILMDTFSEVVFARTSPLQKLLIIASCQKKDSMIAFVGDGINDPLAMTKADLSVTFDRENGAVADVVIADGGFGALVTCLEEGRAIHENLKKSSAFILATNAAILIPIAVYCLVGVPFPLSPIGMIILKYLTDVFLAVALSFEKGESNVMQKTPRIATGTSALWSRPMIFRCCLQTGVIESFAGFFTYFVIMEEYGWSPLALVGIRDRWESTVVNDLEDSRGQKWSYEGRKNLQHLCQTGYFFTQAIMQCANALICRSQRSSLFRMPNRNWMIHFGILFEISIVVSVVYLPHLSDLEQVNAPKPKWWLLPLPYVALLLAQDEVRKYLIRRQPNGWLDRETTD